MVIIQFGLLFQKCLLLIELLKIFRCPIGMHFYVTVYNFTESGMLSPQKTRFYNSKKIVHLVCKVCIWYLFSCLLCRKMIFLDHQSSLLWRDLHSSKDEYSSLGYKIYDTAPLQGTNQDVFYMLCFLYTVNFFLTVQVPWATRDIWTKPENQVCGIRRHFDIT